LGCSLNEGLFIWDQGLFTGLSVTNILVVGLFTFYVNATFANCIFGCGIRVKGARSDEWEDVRWGDDQTIRSVLHPLCVEETGILDMGMREEMWMNWQLRRWKCGVSAKRKIRKVNRRFLPTWYI
jgi:hypothetical protein